MNRLSRYFLLFTAALNTTAVAGMELKTVPLAHPANGDIVHLKATQQLAVSGFSQFARWLSMVELNDFTARQLPIPDDAQFFNQATLAGFDKPQLVFMGIGGISRLNADASEAQRLVTTESIYRVLDQSRLREADFVVNLGSGLSDFIVPDFQYTHVYRQQADGSFVHYALQIPALVQSWQAEPDYKPRKHYLIDADQDGNTDLLFVWQGKFHVFMQQPDGRFATTATVMDWPVPLSTEQEADQRNDAGRSYNGQFIDSLREITDIDGDGIADLVVNREQLTDALERNNAFRVYFGKHTVKGLMFAAEPDTQLTTETSPIEVNIDDINGDGRQDFYIPSTHFGVGTLIRVLLRGSANLDIDFFLLNADRQYPAKADFRQQATIDVSISNFRFDMPLFELADIDGSGKKSLLVGDGQDTLKLYSQEDKRLFSRRGKSYDYALPRDARRVKVADLTDNGKDDIILPFDNQDEQDVRNALRLLLNN